MSRIAALFLFIFACTQIHAQESLYQGNLRLASELFIAKKELPDSVLLKLVPCTDEEFAILYGTTSPGNSLQSTGFFSEVTQQIFNRTIIDRKENFYLPSLQLASFADGEFGEDFTDNLEKIILLDKSKFCKSIKGKSYADRNPIKYFARVNRCE
ncbi:MAG: hypothetical protein IPH88_02090 [Bacteroidales bacterium]|nr:hypothetical protein [Bacteroidales bacterium]